MDNMCSNQILEVPDTPDRAPIIGSNRILDVPDTPDRLHIGAVDIPDSPNSPNSPFSGYSLFGYGHQQGGKKELAPDLLQKESSCKNTSNQYRKASANASRKHSSASINASTSRTGLEKNIRCESGFSRTGHVNGDRFMRKSRSRPSNYQENGACKIRPNFRPELLANPSPIVIEDCGISSFKKTSSVANGGKLDTHGGSSNIRNDANKGKGKMVNDVSETAPSSIELRKGSGVSRDPLHRVSKGLSIPECSAPSAPRVSSGKRLVRNGCISPHNIARSKGLVEHSNCGSKEVPQLGSADVSVGPSHFIDIDEITGHDNASNQAKRKSTFKDFSQSGHLCSNQVQRQNIRRKFAKGKPNTLISHASSTSVASTSSSCLSTEQLNTLHRVPITNCKGQNEEGTCHSREISDADLVCLVSHAESSCSRSRIDCSTYSQNGGPSRIDIDGLSPLVRNNNRDDDLESREKQMHADEMLARELQEQLYREIPDPGRAGRIEVNAPAVHSRRQLQSRIVRNAVHRQRASSRVHDSSLMSLRRRLHNHSSVRLPRRTLSSPSDIDVDMRIDLLAEMEAVFNDDVAMVTRLLQSDQELNESDYEGLLALDDNNHEHLGASFNQISNLPQSIVQTENSETCSICLEVPVVGDTVRHLPCLHKFHKDCIDPWLRRKRSCPVCKTDVFP